MITYEKAKVTDAKAIINMQHKLNTMLGLNEGLEYEVFEGYLTEAISNNKSIYHIAKLQDEIVGCVCIDFDDCIEIGNIEYRASIPLIYLDKKCRGGEVAYNLFKLALKEISERGLNTFVMSIENNNPNKYLHFSIADQIIDARKELLENGGEVIQYILGVSDVKKLNTLSLKQYMQKVIYTKRNFENTLQLIANTNSAEYEIK